VRSMRRVLVLCCAGISPLFLNGASVPPQALIFKGVTVIDATGAPPHKNWSVSVANGRIVAVRKSIRARRGDRVIDAKGKFMIPGLWDMHIHIAAPEIFFPLLVANGITGVREMFTGFPMQTINQWRSVPGAPRIVAPGFIDGPLMLSNGPPPPGAFAVSNAESARIAVKLLAQSGVDFIKVYNSIPRDAYFAIADEAKAARLPFAGHVPEAVSVAEASDAGQRSEEHLINVLLACSTREDELRADRIKVMTDPQMTGEARLRLLAWPMTEGLVDTYSEQKASALFRTFVKNGTWHTPTLIVLAGFAREQDRDFVNDPRQRFLFKAWTDFWNPRNTMYLRDLSPADYDALNARLHELLVRYEKLVGDMHRAGVRFLAGTDASGWNPVLPGFGLHQELALLVESGLTPMEALQSATRNAAQYFGRLEEMGTIEKGKTADLVLLDADPLSDIRNTERIAAVMMRGTLYSRQDLDGMLAQAARAAGK